MTPAAPEIQSTAAGGGAVALPDRVRTLQSSAMSANTQTAYRTDWRAFESWCHVHDVCSMPADPGALAAHVADMAGQVASDGSWRYAPSTISRRVAAIGKVHELAGHPSPARHPVVTTTLSGIRREHSRPVRRMHPLMLADLTTVLDGIDLARFPAGVIGVRDAALLLAGFAGAFRRSELAGLTVGDITFHPEDGVHVRLARSKTDQEGRGAVRALPYGQRPETCPPCAVARWMALLAASSGSGRAGVIRELRNNGRTDVTTHVCRSVRTNVSTGVETVDATSPLFRPVHKSGAIGDGPVTGHAINAMVKRRAAAAGLDATFFGGHSLRAGFVTQAVRAGADAGEIMRQTGHRTPAMVEVYRRENAPLIGNAVTRVGL